MSSLRQSHQVFFGCTLGLHAITSTSNFIQSASSLCSTGPNHLNLLFLVIELTGSNPNCSLSSSIFFLSFSLTRHIHLIILISVQFNFISFPKHGPHYHSTIAWYNKIKFKKKQKHSKEHSLCPGSCNPNPNTNPNVMGSLKSNQYYLVTKCTLPKKILKFFNNFFLVILLTGRKMPGKT